MAFTFGQTKTTTSSNMFGGFGKTTTTTAASSGGLFGSSAFGTKTTSAASGGLFGSGGTGFGTKTTAASGGGLFGSTQGFGAKTTSASTGGLFGSTQGFGAKTTTASSGGLFGSTSGFGAKSTASGGLFSTTNSMFNSKPAGTTSMFGTGSTGTAFNFGGGTKLSGGLNAAATNAQNNQQDPKAMELLATATALSSPVLFGDAKDKIIMKWNQLQAYWGCGRGFYNKEGACIVFNPQNYFSRFKAVGYSLMPTSTDEKGFVSLVCKKKQQEMEAVGNQQITACIHKIMGGNSNLSVTIESIRNLPNERCEVTIYVSEMSSITGSTRRVFAHELHNFLQQANMRQQLEQQLAMETCVARVAMSSQQINRLLSQPPAGIDPVVWEQAKIDNPDPKSLITVPMLGFDQLKSRLEHQQIMAKQHQKRLDIMSEGLEKAKHELTNTKSKIDLHRRKYLELSHRLLQVIIMQEIVRKSGLALQPDEENLRVKLENFVQKLNAPMKYRGRLNELLSQTRTHHHYQLTGDITSTAAASSSIIDEVTLKEMKEHLMRQQQGLKVLMDVLNSDFQHLNIIEKQLEHQNIICQ